MASQAQKTYDAEKGHPQRYGYPSLAALIAHDADSELHVFRKFNRLSARNLLNMQSRLIELERRLDDWDEAAKRSQDFDLRQSLRRWETFEEKAQDPQRPENERWKLDVSTDEEYVWVAGSTMGQPSEFWPSR